MGLKNLRKESKNIFGFQIIILIQQKKSYNKPPKIQSVFSIRVLNFPRLPR